MLSNNQTKILPVKELQKRLCFRYNSRNGGVFLWSNRKRTAEKRTAGRRTAGRRTAGKRTAEKRTAEKGQQKKDSWKKDSWKKDGRKEVVMVDLEALVPKEHLLRKVEKVMDYAWLYERLSPYYCHDNGRPGTDPVVLIKMVLIRHLFGIPSLRQTHQRYR